MKPAYEHVDFGAHGSVRIYHRRLPRIPFEWHHHPEYELTLTLNSHGKRYIGDSVAEYGADDLVLVPPDLAHTWASNRSADPAQPQVAIVVWFDGAWARRLADCCPEYEPLHRLLRRGTCGLCFPAPQAQAMREQLPELLAAEPRRRLAATLELLCRLADAPAQALASPGAFAGPAGAAGAATGHEPERINRVLALMESRLAEPLRIADLCAAAHWSPRSLQRYFLQHLGESVVQHLTRLRIGRACRLLADTRLPVSEVAARCGFGNLAHFNRQFKAARQTTPSAYRRQFAQGPAPEAAAPPRDAGQLDRRPPSLRRAARRRAIPAPAGD
ncbi:MAG: helix-turn-helix domain-containing protein [Betaproteobacteria bacterium]|nr:helix-turn-helix domain-containing protein [Betaproteobacteria bacterium]MBU6512163.1 helix-turn-helix domain-containing protein [Betaproteobacteria bacterium]MDE1954522.1 helix-turn-helix domain-containing protein [Betaproteobacteria bacterium]MDE2151901.1 helix-turn-helix domain-containing protein [Betaproteobacteria bacterium]MDE2478425.1 helix-turn-helix domain-containing protein [Betaproteobacteria bacterium]